MIPVATLISPFGDLLWKVSSYGSIFVIRTFMHEFFLFWFFSIGIWNLHPRILKVLNEKTSLNSK
jgi:hypothetical protein